MCINNQTKVCYMLLNDFCMSLKDESNLYRNSMMA